MVVTIGPSCWQRQPTTGAGDGSHPRGVFLLATETAFSFTLGFFEFPVVHYFDAVVSPSSSGVMEKYFIRNAVTMLMSGMYAMNCGWWLKYAIAPVTINATSRWPMTFKVEKRVRPILVFTGLFPS
jgi:hypothetical protein